MTGKRILTIQDISCVGQCSMTVALPILAAWGHQTSILPTAVLSTHTGGFGKPVVQHLTGQLLEIGDHWHRAGITFDAVLVGYLGSLEAIRGVEYILEMALAPGGKLLVDPAMADHGKLYSGLDGEYAEAMKNLCLRADVMLPNLTEGAMIAGLPLEEPAGRDYAFRLLKRLEGGDVVLTGVEYGPGLTGAAFRDRGEIGCYQHARIGGGYPGTGDIFAACFAGAWIRGKTMAQAVALAAEFTRRCIESTHHSAENWYGVRFETELPWLMEQL